MLCMRDEEQWGDMNGQKERSPQDPSFCGYFRRLADDLVSCISFISMVINMTLSRLLVSYPVQSTGQPLEKKTRGKLVLPVCLITSESQVQIPFISTLMDASFYLQIPFCFPFSQD